MQSSVLSSRTETETRDDSQETVIGRDKLEYASLTDVLLGQPVNNYRNNSVQTKRVHGWTEEAIDSWLKWLDEGKEKGWLTPKGEYRAAKVIEKPLPLPPAGPKGIDDVIGVDWENRRDGTILECDLDKGVICVDQAVERRRRRLQLLDAAGRRQPF